MKKGLLYGIGILGAVLLFSVEIGSIYYIMPFPGSQREESVDLAYFLHHHIAYFRIAGFLLALFPAIVLVRHGSLTLRTIVITIAVVYAMVFYQVRYKMRADEMFLQPRQVVLLPPESNKVDRRKLILGIDVGGVARAYPIEVIGYHHQVRDTVNGQPIMVTYCTVCRTGRVFRPVVNGQPEEFRLVGMDHFNAMFEDQRTKSWWRQVSGEAIAGPLKGAMLEEIPVQQMSLLAWIDHHPATLILQPDSTFKKEYEELEQFDEGTLESSLERRDSLSWKEKSWVVGVRAGMASKAYDWNDLVNLRVINDQLDGLPVLLTLESDSVSFHAWQRDTLEFEFHTTFLRDRNTLSTWNWRGQCVEGPLQGSRLAPVQAYQEFWHSWKTFHPQTATFDPRQ